MDSEVAGSGGKRRRLWVAGGVGAVLMVGVLAGLVANASRSGSASDIITFACSGQTYWFDKTEKKRYGDIENKQDKLETAYVLKSKCRYGEAIYDQEFNKFLSWTFDGFADFWVLNGDGERCTFRPANLDSFFISVCEPVSRLDEYYVLRKD
jgi:hypothetical protein